LPRDGAKMFPKDSKSPERRFGAVSPGAERAGKLAVEPSVDRQRAERRFDYTI